MATLFVSSSLASLMTFNAALRLSIRLDCSARAFSDAMSLTPTEFAFSPLRWASLVNSSALFVKSFNCARMVAILISLALCASAESCKSFAASAKSAQLCLSLADAPSSLRLSALTSDLDESRDFLRPLLCVSWATSLICNAQISALASCAAALALLSVFSNVATRDSISLALRFWSSINNASLRRTLSKSACEYSSWRSSDVICAYMLV
mmetsp:Transcript_584/g.1825  ORF Transcript_584/g.1825 Transcript_584/m.1825 type:complete len:210 (+) Transcript_584:640-1269(+)